MLSFTNNLVIISEIEGLFFEADKVRRRSRHYGWPIDRFTIPRRNTR